jgi:hypothetical protein
MRSAFEKRSANFAAGWAEYGRIFFGIAFDATVDLADSKIAFGRAMEAANRAIALDPNLADGYVVRSRIRSDYLWDVKGAQADLERAVALSPNDAFVLQRKRCRATPHVPKVCCAALKPSRAEESCRRAG